MTGFILPSMKVGPLIMIALIPAGCVQRELTVISNPPGAVVTLNDREIGRTPFTRQFLWYGNYDVVLRKDGFQTLKTSAEITAPFWQFVPLDAVTDFLPLTDNETIQFTLQPDQQSDPNLLVQRGAQMRADLEASDLTVHKSVLEVYPTTRPVTRPSTDSSE